MEAVRGGGEGRGGGGGDEGEKKTPRLALLEARQAVEEHGRAGEKRQQDRVSRAMSKVLRHTAKQVGVDMTPEGYVEVEKLVRVLPKGADVSAVKSVVDADQKHRFGWKVDGDGKAWVRANQGHSHELVERDALLHRITHTEDLPKRCVHGTTRDAWEKIKAAKGLARMGRNEIHLATGDFSDGSAVVSGMRKSSQVHVYVDAVLCLERGVPLYLSENGVVLCPGLGPRGVLPTGYFARVVDARTGSELEFERTFDLVDGESAGQDDDEAARGEGAAAPHGSPPKGDSADSSAPVF